MKAIKTLGWFRKIAIAEGISFLVLLGIAMPLKYFADMPMAVKITGYIHGFLFIGFVLLAWETKNNLNKNFSWFGLAFLASLLPFGTFVLDKHLKKEEKLLRD
jgi:integral membrane protein